MDSQESPAAYYRLGAGQAAYWRRKSKSLSVLNIVLVILLVLCTFVLLSAVLHRHNAGRGPCVFPGPGSRCFWPFARHHTVLLISMDGFRHDYLENVRARLGPNSLPNFARFEAGGIRANQSVNIFPTVTMPNHQTLLTGLYAQHHGIVGNNVLDTHWPNLLLSMDNQTSLNEDPWLDDWPEPIWATLQKAGGLAGSLLWPLTDRPVDNDLPFQQVSQFTLLDNNMIRYPYTKRVDDLLWWLSNSRFHLDLIMAYFDEPDETGHAYGPDSPELADTVVHLDSTLGRFLDGLEHHGLLDKVDIILTADHGMSSISADRLIPLDKFVDPSLYHCTQFSTVGFLYPAAGKAQEVYDKLHGAHEHLHVYWLHDVPKDLHFSLNTSRMPPIVLVPDPLWYIVHKQDTHPIAGNHGFSPNFTEMHPFFIASGPSFRAGETVEVVNSVDVYPLLCRLLQIAPKPHNGSFARIATELLKPEVAERLMALDRWPQWLFWLAIEAELLWFLFMFTLVLFITVGLVLSLRVQHRYKQLALHSEDEYDGKHTSLA
ncbi:unnamed protein product [Dicrocoelium dendriticum]|nr:unnamed protein product [Dicrocoelium dendriticum]